MPARRKPTTKAKPKPRKPSSHGGARPGSGRKQAVIPPEVMERVGPLPPQDRPLDVANWWQAIIGELAILEASTGRYQGMAQSMARLSGAAMRAMPWDAIREANKRLVEDTAALKASTRGPQERDAGESSARALHRSAG